MKESKRRPDAVFLTSQAVGDAWSWLIMREVLLFDVRRFADFQSRLGIARSTLSARLAQLVSGGLLTRGSAGADVSEDYVPTPAGEDFFDCLMAAMAWGDRWYAEGGKTPLRVTHQECDGPAAPEYRCASCRKVVVAHDVSAVHAERRLGATRLEGQNHRAPGYELLERNRPCSIARAQMVLGDWWSSMVVREAFFGVHRFDEFRSNLGVSTNILASRLSRLVDHDILTRTPYQSGPIRHEYRLTDKGFDLYPVPLAIIAWGDRWKSPEGPLIRLTHVPCGKRLKLVLSCGTCSAPVSRAKVDVGYNSRRGDREKRYGPP